MRLRSLQTFADQIHLMLWRFDAFGGFGNTPVFIFQQPFARCVGQKIPKKHVYKLLYFQYNGNMEEKEVIKSLAALAQPNRLQLFRALVTAGKAGATPGQLGENLGVPNATLSFHLKELLNAGLINQERSGRQLIYRVEFMQVNHVIAYLTKNCCQGSETCF